MLDSEGMVEAELVRLSVAARASQSVQLSLHLLSGRLWVLLFYPSIQEEGHHSNRKFLLRMHSFLAIVLAIEVFNRFHFYAPCLIQSSKLLTLTYTAGIPGVAAEQSTSEEGNKR